MSALAVVLLFAAGLVVGAAVVLARTLASATSPAAQGGHLRSVVEPLHRSLTHVEDRLRELEVARVAAYAGLSEQVAMLRETHELLRDHTANLVTALRAPATRGRWGELQLRRVVELAGMVPHCDFTEQVTRQGDGTGGMRPDMVVRLPAGGSVVVDAKAPMLAYLAALDAETDDERRARGADHARQLRSHIDRLSAKEYWRQFDPTPEFVVLFLPGDPLLGAALEHDPALLEHAAASSVLLATPMSLIALLRAVAHGWRQEALAENAARVCAVGREMHGRLAGFVEHLAAVGRGLDRATDAYNRAVGSLESRVLVSARRFTELGVTDDLLAELPRVERLARQPQPAPPG